MTLTLSLPNKASTSPRPWLIHSIYQLLSCLILRMEELFFQRDNGTKMSLGFSKAIKMKLKATNVRLKNWANLAANTNFGHSDKNKSNLAMD